MLEKIKQLLEEVNALQAASPEEAEALRIKYLSKKGEISALMADFRNVPAELKKEVGMRINELKDRATARINELKNAAAAKETVADDIDLTRTPYPINMGTRHCPDDLISDRMPIGIITFLEEIDVYKDRAHLLLLFQRHIYELGGNL